MRKYESHLGCADLVGAQEYEEDDGQIRLLTIEFLQETVKQDGVDEVHDFIERTPFVLRVADIGSIFAIVGNNKVHDHDEYGQWVFQVKQHNQQVYHIKFTRPPKYLNNNLKLANTKRINRIKQRNNNLNALIKIKEQAVHNNSTILSIHANECKSAVVSSKYQLEYQAFMEAGVNQWVIIYCDGDGELLGLFVRGHSQYMFIYYYISLYGLLWIQICMKDEAPMQEQSGRLSRNAAIFYFMLVVSTGYGFKTTTLLPSQSPNPSSSSTLFSTTFCENEGVRSCKGGVVLYY